jgi:hypothetical protein
MANQVIVVRDVTFNWPKLVDKHSPFGTLQWDVQVVTNNDATKAQLESAGVKMKKGDNGYYANIKRKAVKANGEPQEPPKVVDTDKEEMAPSKIKSMGNGSKGHIKLFSYDWEMAGKKGVSAMLVAMQITDYVSYDGAGDDF